MKRLLLIICLIFAVSIPVAAEEKNDGYESDLNKIAEEYSIDFESVKLSPVEYIGKTVKDIFYKNISQPVNLFLKILSVLILISFINYFSYNQSDQLVKIINLIGVLVIFSVVYIYLAEIVDNIGEMFFEVKNFMISFLPVFAGISFASGEMITSTVYTGFFLLAIVTLANFCINYIFPFISVFMAIGITSSVSSSLNIYPLCEFCSKIVKTAMTAAVSILCFVLSLQTTITQGQDTLAVKTGKVLVTSTIPVIGSTLQGAIGSVYASMGVLKGFCGVVGIVVLLNIFLPHIIRLSINWVGFSLLAVISNVFENKSSSKLILVFKDIIEILISMSVLFMILLLFSISIMIKTFQGV